MGLDDLEYIYGQTSIDPEEREGLKIKTISTREELNEFEEYNIKKAIEWIYGKRLAQEKILSEKFIQDIHIKMFGDIWKWAGKYRLTNKNIGVDKYQIVVKIKNLIDDCNYWISNNTFPKDEICIRFKHKLVTIHPFPNGNGRHSRLMADILSEKVFSNSHFSWGGKGIIKEIDVRKSYIQSLKSADTGDYSSLIQFARS